jgi:hypothetical protein
VGRVLLGRGVGRAGSRGASRAGGAGRGVRIDGLVVGFAWYN